MTGSNESQGEMPPVFYGFVDLARRALTEKDEREARTLAEQALRMYAGETEGHRDTRPEDSRELTLSGHSTQEATGILNDAFEHFGSARAQWTGDQRNTELLRHTLTTLARLAPDTARELRERGWKEIPEPKRTFLKDSAS